MQGLPLFASRRNVFLQLILFVAVPMVLLLTVLSQAVFGQHTFLITEGDQVIVHRSDATDPAVALEEAGIKADPHEYRMYQSKENVYNIRVVRDDAVVVMNCGEKMYVAIEEDTVGQLLKRAGVPTGAGYEISCSLDTELEDGMTIVVTSMADTPESTPEPLIDNGVALLPGGEAVSCSELEAE